MNATQIKKELCWRCRGDGYFWRVPNGFNPFSAGGWATARAAWRVDCYECRAFAPSASQDGSKG